MSVLAFDFPVQSSVDRARFAAQGIAWIKGMEKSSLFDSQASIDKFDDEASISNTNGESLTLKEVQVNGGYAIGIKYDFKESEQIIWRTEITLTRIGAQSSLRSRSQCISFESDIHDSTPKKPYFIKLALNDSWGGLDHELIVKDSPHLLVSGDERLASAILSGKSECRLPILYISRKENGSTIFSEKMLDAISFQLGGMAHVVVEPNTQFSRTLIDIHYGRNPYDGAIGIALRRKGLSKRIVNFSSFKNEHDLSKYILEYIGSYNESRQPEIALDWQNIIEESHKQLRARFKAGEIEFDSWLAEQERETVERERERIEI